MREFRTSGSERGAPGDRRPYRDHTRPATSRGAQPQGHVISPVAGPTFPHLSELTHCMALR